VIADVRDIEIVQRISVRPPGPAPWRAGCCTTDTILVKQRALRGDRRWCGARRGRFLRSRSGPSRNQNGTVAMQLTARVS